jgi:hypothetical protein
MNAAFQRLAEVGDDRIDAQTKEWRSKVRELSYDIQDCADRFRLLHSSDEAKLNFVRRMARKVRRLWVEDPEISREIRELKARAMEKERRDRYDIGLSLSTTTQPAPPGPGLDPRALAFYEEARDLVGIDGPRDQIIGWLGSEEEQLKVVSIFGVGGQGKTTLAMEVYRKAQEHFDCRASVSVSRTLDINRILRDILFQTNMSAYERSERWEAEQLIRATREYLMDKR